MLTKLKGYPEFGKLIHKVSGGPRIIEHFVHSYDEKGNVIVIPGKKEDLALSIGQYQKEVGPSNIVRMIVAGGDPISVGMYSNRDKAFYGDYSNMDAHSINEVSDIKVKASISADKSLAEFNKKYGTSFDLNTFIDLAIKGKLEDIIKSSGEESK